MIGTRPLDVDLEYYQNSTRCQCQHSIEDAADIGSSYLFRGRKVHHKISLEKCLGGCMKECHIVVLEPREVAGSAS